MSRIAEAYYAQTGHYPNSPGWKEPTTSRAAAESMKPGLGRMQDRVMAEIKRRGAAGATPDEIAAALGITVLTIRPRVTELSRLQLIVKTGARRKNTSKRDAAVWKDCQ